MANSPGGSASSVSAKRPSIPISPVGNDKQGEEFLDLVDDCLIGKALLQLAIAQADWIKDSSSHAA